MVLGKTDDIQRDHGTAAHGVNVAEAIGRRDGAEVIRRIGDGRKEVHRLDNRQLVGESINTGIVGRRGAYQDVWVGYGGQAAQNLSEIGGADFRSSATALGKLGHADLFWCHRSPPFRLREHEV